MGAGGLLGEGASRCEGLQGGGVARRARARWVGWGGGLLVFRAAAWQMGAMTACGSSSLPPHALTRARPAPRARPCPPQRCFGAAVGAGFTGVQILNHIDSQDHSEWRNFLDLDVTQKYGGWSYEDIVVRPAAEALKAVLKPSTKVRG